MFPAELLPEHAEPVRRLILSVAIRWTPLRVSSKRYDQEVAADASTAVRKHFYEKVVRVKADVAAILKFFLLIPQIEADITDAAPGVPIGGMRKGGFSGAL